MSPNPPNADPPEGGESPESPASQALLRHDFKNHLTAMRSGCDLLRRYLDAGDEAQVRSYLAQMQRELQNGFALVDRLPGPR